MIFLSYDKFERIEIFDFEGDEVGPLEWWDFTFYILYILYKLLSQGKVLPRAGYRWVARVACV
jgi:hypothetical protein